MRRSTRRRRSSAARAGLLGLGLLAAPFALAAGADSPPAASCATPAPDADWDVAAPAEAGFDAPALCRLLEGVAGGSANIHAVLGDRRFKRGFEDR